LDPDQKLGGKWDPDPDPKKIVTDPQHFLKVPVPLAFVCNKMIEIFTCRILQADKDFQTLIL
jgi:hypothetical protein